MLAAANLLCSEVVVMVVVAASLQGFVRDAWHQLLFAGLTVCSTHDF